MKKIKLSVLFEVKYGHSYELINMVEEKNGIPFISRSAEANGVTARVVQSEGLPTPAGCLTVALGGSSVLSTFLQPEPCYEGRDVAILTPKTLMTDSEKIWYARAIRENQFRFNYGRQANRELPNLVLPEAPDWAKSMPIPDYTAKAKPEIRESVHVNRWKFFKITDVATITN